MQQDQLTSRRTGSTRAGVRAVGLFITATLAAAGSASAQDSDDAAQEDRWAAAAEFTMTASDGNQNVTVLTSGFTLRHLRKELFEFQLNLQARYGSSGGEQVVENYNGTLNFDIGPRQRWSPFLYSTAEHDPFKRLDVRVNSGAGAKYRLYRAEDRGEASLSLAVLHSYEALSTESAMAVTRSARWSLRLLGRQQLHDGVDITSEALYQPVYNDADDYLLAVDAGVKVLVTRHIALSIAHELNKDSTPAEGVEESDRLLKAGILIEL